MFVAMLLPQTFIDLHTLTPLFEERFRIEQRRNVDYGNSLDLFEGFTTRTRAGFRKSFETGKLTVLYQYATNAYPKAGFTPRNHRSDILYGFVDLPAKGLGTFTIGRQLIVTGGGRLFGESDWGLTSRSWDAVRLKGAQFDVFAGHLAVNQTPNSDASVAAASKKTRFGETLYAFKSDRRAHRDIHTLDHRFLLKYDKFSLDFEAAGQFGHIAGKEQRAWATTAKVGYAATNKFGLYVEGNAASGGSNADTVFTFDQLYASNHRRLGVMDLQGWRNMQALTLGATWKQDKKTDLFVEYHRFGLRDPADAWYSDGGSASTFGGGTFADPTGQSGRDVGQEFDLVVDHRLTKESSLQAGLCSFKPGRFISNVMGAGAHDQSFAYVAFTLKY